MKIIFNNPALSMENTDTEDLWRVTYFRRVTCNNK
jgi:hypothetical protein